MGGKRKVHYFYGGMREFLIITSGEWDGLPFTRVVLPKEASELLVVYFEWSSKEVLPPRLCAQ